MGRGGMACRNRVTGTTQELSVMREMAKWQNGEQYEVWNGSLRTEYALPLPFILQTPSLPVSPSHGFLRTLFSSDTGRMAPVGKCRLGRKSGISSSHELGCVMCLYHPVSPYRKSGIDSRCHVNTHVVLSSVIVSAPTSTWYSLSLSLAVPRNEDNGGFGNCNQSASILD
jgi:hypothetical protein